MIISTISWGSVGLGDVRIVEGVGEVPSERIILWILASLRYQTRFASSSITVHSLSVTIKGGVGVVVGGT